MWNIVFRLSFSKNILVSARIFWSKGAKICERLSLVPRLPLSLQTNGQSWYFLCLQIQHLSKKQSEDESSSLSSAIVTVEHSCVLDIIVEKFLPPPHSSHLHMFRRQFRVSVKSSAIALGSRIRLNCVLQSSKARLVNGHSCAHWFAALFVPICAPQIPVNYGKYLRWGEWFFTFLDIFDSLSPFQHSILNKIN